MVISAFKTGVVGGVGGERGRSRDLPHNHHFLDGNSEFFYQMIWLKK
jgi:hypothetical protein